MSYNPIPPDQWAAEDLAAAEAAKDWPAIEQARREGLLHDILNPPKPQPDDDRLAAALGTTPPVGPTVPGQQPGAPGTGGTAGQWSAADLDRAAAERRYDDINAARRAGLLRQLGA